MKTDKPGVNEPIVRADAARTRRIIGLLREKRKGRYLATYLRDFIKEGRR